VGVDQAARVLDEAVRTCPALGAVAAEMTTTVVAVLKPEAFRSSLRRESFPTQKVVEVVPKDGRLCWWSDLAREVAVPSAAVSPGVIAPGVAVVTLCL